MTLTKTERNDIYTKLFDRMLRPTEATDQELVQIVESVIGTEKNVSVNTNGNRKEVTVNDGKEDFKVSLLSEVPDDIPNNFTMIRD